MQKRWIFLTIVTICVCGVVFFKLTGSAVLAQTATSTPQPVADFLGPIYYGQTYISSIFDHNLPGLSAEIDDLNNWVDHNNGLRYSPPITQGLGYDGHDGIDYGLEYKPILPAHNGTIVKAGWSNPQDHTYGLGLHIRVEHPTNRYKTEYGHLSVINVQTGQSVVANPYDRQNIMAISGNTGWSDGAHLHFGLINPDNKRVNPYGWQGLPGVDPWEDYWLQRPELNKSASSYDLWVQKPAIHRHSNLPTLQYANPGPIVDLPYASQGGLVADNDYESYYSITPPGCMTRSASGGYLGTYDYTPTIPIAYPPQDICQVEWRYWGSQAGPKHLFVHIPNNLPEPVANEATYTIYHNGEVDESIVVQSEYSNGGLTLDPFVYIGTYYFQGNGNERVRMLNVSSVDIVGSRFIVADAIRFSDDSPTGCPISTGVEEDTGEMLSGSWYVSAEEAGIRISWADFSDLNELRIYRHTTNDFSGAVEIYMGGDSTGQWLDDTVTPGVAYYYWLDILYCMSGAEMLGPEAATALIRTPTLAFNVNGTIETYVQPLTSFTLNWNSNNATECVASGSWRGSKPISGSYTTTTKKDGTYVYTLTCINEYGYSSPHSVTVYVSSYCICPPPDY